MAGLSGLVGGGQSIDPRASALMSSEIERLQSMQRAQLGLEVLRLSGDVPKVVTDVAYAAILKALTP